MNFNEQIEELQTRVVMALQGIDEASESISKLRSDIGRLKRTQKAMIDDDISVDVTINGKSYYYLSNVIGEIIETKEDNLACFEDDVKKVKDNIKKYTKIIDTLSALNVA